MSLPKLEHPTFTLKLPSTEQEIVYRPFLVKEEKILLIALQTKDPAGIIRAIKQVITNCIVTPNVDTDSFTTFDLEFFFLRIRAKSVNNVVSLTYKDNEDNKERTFDIDLDALEVVFDPAHKKIIQIKKGMQLVLKYPTLDVMDKIPSVQNGVQLTFELINSCMDKLIIEKAEGEDEVYLFSQQTRAEVEEWLGTLPSKSFKAIQKFFDTMPHLEHIITYTNEKNTKQEIKLRTLDDFFMLG